MAILPKRAASIESLGTFGALFLVISMGILFLAGCTPSIQGAPDRLLGLNEELEVAKKLASPKWYVEYATSTGQRKRELRDQIVLSRMYAIDLNYSEYEIQLTQERQNVGFYSTVASLALTSSATALAAKETKTILSAVATGVTGTRTAYDTEILIEKTITILQQQMRARRNEVKAKIVERLALSTEAYPLELALPDIESYYRAGTFTGAFIDVTEETGARLSQARALEDVIVTKFSPVTDLGARIARFARSSAINKARVEEQLKEMRIRLSVPAFTRSQAHRSQQLEMIQKLNIP